MPDAAKVPHIVEPAGGADGVAYVDWLTDQRPWGYAGPIPVAPSSPPSTVRVFQHTTTSHRPAAPISAAPATSSVTTSGRVR